MIYYLSSCCFRLNCHGQNSILMTDIYFFHFYSPSYKRHFRKTTTYIINYLLKSVFISLSFFCFFCLGVCAGPKARQLLQSFIHAIRTYIVPTTMLLLGFRGSTVPSYSEPLLSEKQCCGLSPKFNNLLKMVSSHTTLHFFSCLND